MQSKYGMSLESAVSGQTVKREHIPRGKAEPREMAIAHR